DESALPCAEPDLDHQLAAFERDRRCGGESGLRQQAGDSSVGEAEPRMRMAVAELLALMRVEIVDGNPPARPRDPRRLGQRSGRVLCEVEPLMQQHRVETASGE